MLITGTKISGFLLDGSAISPRSMCCCSSMAMVWVVDWLSMVIFTCGYFSMKPFK